MPKDNDIDYQDHREENLPLVADTDHYKEEKDDSVVKMDAVDLERVMETGMEKLSGEMERVLNGSAQILLFIDSDTEMVDKSEVNVQLEGYDFESEEISAPGTRYMDFEDRRYINGEKRAVGARILSQEELRGMARREGLKLSESYDERTAIYFAPGASFDKVKVPDDSLPTANE